MQDTRYTVWITNADLEEVKNFYIGESRDIAETIACRLFVKSEYRKDYMITKRPPGGETEIHGLLLTEKTKGMRGECRG